MKESISVHKKVLEWLVSDDTGTPSKTLCSLYFGVPKAYQHHPCDPSDFGRCIRFLDRLLPCEKTVVLNRAKQLSPEWKALAGEWDYLVSLYGKEGLFEKMRSLIGKAKER